MNINNSKFRARKRLMNLPPTDSEEQNELGNKMVRYVKDHPFVLFLEEFPLSLYIAPSKFYSLADENEYFASCLNWSQWQIAFRLKEMWRKDYKQKDFALRFLPLYDAAYREYTMQKIFMSEKAKASNSTFIVQQPPIPDSPLVPTRKV